MNRRWVCYKSSTVHFPIHPSLSSPLAHLPLIFIILPRISLFHFPSFLNGRVVGLLAVLKEHIFSPLSSTGNLSQVLWNTISLSPMNTHFNLLQKVLSVARVCLSLCHHLDAGEINSDAGQPLKRALWTVVIQNTPWGQVKLAPTFPHVFRFCVFHHHLHLPFLFFI